MSSTLLKRIVSAAIAGALLLFTLFFKGIFLKILVLFLIYICLYEFVQAFIKKGYHIDYRMICLTVSPFLVHFVIFNDKPIKNSLYFLALGVFLHLIYYLLSDMNINEFMIGMLSISYITFPISFLYNLIRFSNEKYVWLIILISFSTDTFAFFTGKLFGRHKLIPKLSPNKTVEGAVGGIVGATAVAMAANHILGISLETTHVVIIGICGSIASQIGDLFASKIKRFCEIKDFGNIMPGHGGIIDRIDSIIAVTLLFIAAYYKFI